MKRAHKIVLASCMTGLVLPSVNGGSSEEMYAPVNYLELTRADLPNARSLVDAAYSNLDFNMTSFKERIQRVERSAWLPESVNFNYLMGVDGISDYGFSGKTSEETNYNTDSTVNNEKTTTDQLYGTIPNKYSNRHTYTLSARWDLQKLFGVNEEEINTLAEVINQIDQEGFALGQIARSYGQLVSALPEEPTMAVSEAQAYVILEHAAILDSLSGGMLSKTLRVKSGAGVVVVGNGNGLEKEMRKTDESLQPENDGIIEVRDGQDDGVEVIGGASK